MTTQNIQINSSQTLLGQSNQLIPSYGNLDELPAAKPAITKHIVSVETDSVMKAIEALKAKPSLTTRNLMPLRDVPVEEHLFDARANVKIMTSAVSMHIDSGLREKIFRQIDMLHDPDDWEPDDIPIGGESFKAFLSGFIQINPERGPGLGLSHTGNLIASWVSDRDRLIIEFMPNNVKWVITRFINDEQEQFTGHTKVTRLFESLVPYDIEHWFSKK